MSDRRYRLIATALNVLVVLCVATVVILIQTQGIANQHLILQNQASRKAS